MKAVLLLATLAVVSTTITSHAAQYRGVGFDTNYVPVQDVDLRPWMDQPMNTTQVSEHVQREAVLSCMEESPVQRAVICDIMSWDSCGNIYGTGEEDKDWLVVATNQVTGVVARLQSPVFHLKDGVSRFYFTPLDIGIYEIVVTRSPASVLPELFTNMTMISHTVIHDLVADCSNRRMSETLGQFQDTLWAESAYLNDRAKNAGMPSYSLPTDIIADKLNNYNQAVDGGLQSDVRREPILQYQRDYRIKLLPSDDNHQMYCDMIRRT